MAPIPVWSGNLRLSLILVPVRLYPATSTEGAIAFRMIHADSGVKILMSCETECFKACCSGSCTDRASVDDQIPKAHALSTHLAPRVYNG
jgi:hypothetical protein